MSISHGAANGQLMQKINRLKALECIRDKGPLARPGIGRMTGLSPSTITNIVSYLLEKGLVEETGTVDTGEVGRKATLIRFNPGACSIIAISIEAMRIDLALTNLTGEALAIRQVPLERALKDYEILQVVREEINQLLACPAGRKTAAVAGIGIAVSGIVRDGGRLVLSSSLRWKELPLKQQFEDAFHLPVYVQNNSQTKALWVLKHNLDETDDNVVFLDLAMGVGIISLYQHKLNKAVVGEFGHTTVKKDGPLCFCGNRGCLEVMCSVDGVVAACRQRLAQGGCHTLGRLMAQHSPEAVSYDLILEAYGGGDGDVGEVLRECGEFLGIGIANLINIFNPKRIIINADELLQSEYVYQTALAEAGRRAYGQFVQDVKYQKVHISTREAVQGVALYVAQKLCDLSGPLL